MKSGTTFKTGCLTLIIIFILCCICLSGSDGSVEDILAALIALFVGAVIAVIFWICAAYKAAKEFCVYVRDAVIDLFTIKREVKTKCPAALRAKILEKRQHSVKVGVFDSDGAISDKVTISTDSIVSDDIYEGQVIAV